LNGGIFSPVHRVIAIDGPAASGKSSVACELAQRLGFVYVNSGALYRALTWYLLQRGVDVRDPAAIADALEQARIACDLRDGESSVCIDELDAAEHLRDAEVNAAVSLVSSVPRVRESVNEKLRHYAQRHDVVIEGRDIGSAVFPATPFKFYIDALPELRAQRRAAQAQRDEIAARDQFDSARALAPLMIAPDADVIDTSALTIPQVVEEIIGRLAAKGLEQHTPR
jgi:cytidylate kinase